MNVTRAAENLYMTQPAVSRSIHEIEQVYGVRLFERLNQRLYLTDSGRRMRAYAVHIVDTFDQMERELSDGDERGMLRIGASILEKKAIHVAEYFRYTYLSDLPEADALTFTQVEVWDVCEA